MIPDVGVRRDPAGPPHDATLIISVDHAKICHNAAIPGGIVPLMLRKQLPKVKT